MSGDTLIAIALGVVLVILMAGLFTLFRDGQEARNWSNRLMRYRVLAQFAAIVIIMAVLFFSGR
jgi:uncharacterized membrane protein YdjX (TVP38/TMEM64 family)